MAQAKVYDSSSGSVSTQDVDVSTLGGGTRKRLLRSAVLRYQANLRQGTHSTKTRGMLDRSGRKPFRQKGTGRARAGDFASPLWKGGGTIFGPHPRSYRTRMPKKARREALRSALLTKFEDGQVSRLQGAWDTPSTKQAHKALKELGATAGGTLVVVPESSDVLHRSFRNIPRVQVVPAVDVNAYDLLKARHLVLIDDALDRILARLPELKAAETGGDSDAN